MLRHARRTVAALALAAGSAGAQETTFVGFTNGCFGAGCTPGTTAAAESQSVFGGLLRFVNSTFTLPTSGGFAAFQGPAVAAGQNVDNLGSFVLDRSLAAPGGSVLDGESFTLRISFTNPSNRSDLYDALLSGTVRPTNDRGGLSIDFLEPGLGNSPIALAFTGLTATFNLEDANIAPSEVSTAVTGNISGVQQVVPEPATVALFGVGLLGLAGVARRRARA